MTFETVPRDLTQVDPGLPYQADTPFPIKQATLSPRRHRWFDVRDIGVQTPPYTVTPGLTSGAVMRVQYDHRPDMVIVSLSGATVAATGGAFVYLGEVGGPFVRLGAGGRVVLPAPENGVVSIRAIGSTPCYGTVIAVAGYDNLPRIDLLSGFGASPAT